MFKILWKKFSYFFEDEASTGYKECTRPHSRTTFSTKPSPNLQPRNWPLPLPDSSTTWHGTAHTAPMISVLTKWFKKGEQSSHTEGKSKYLKLFNKGYGYIYRPFWSFTFSKCIPNVTRKLNIVRINGNSKMLYPSRC